MTFRFDMKWGDKMNIIEIMKCEVCHNHKSNCDICPIRKQCENGELQKLIDDYEAETINNYWGVKMYDWK